MRRGSLAIILVLATVFAIASGSVNAAEPTPETSCCGGSNLIIWYFERWVDGKLIDEGRLKLRPIGYTPGQCHISAIVEIPGFPSRDINLDAPKGQWLLVGTEENPDFLYCSTGGDWNELPLTLRSRQWDRVDLPSGMGQFYGLAYEIGTTWKVTLDGQEFQATAVNVDPDASFKLHSH